MHPTTDLSKRSNTLNIHVPCFSPSKLSKTFHPDWNSYHCGKTYNHCFLSNTQPALLFKTALYFSFAIAEQTVLLLPFVVSCCCFLLLLFLCVCVCVCVFFILFFFTKETDSHTGVNRIKKKKKKKTRCTLKHPTTDLSKRSNTDYQDNKRYQQVTPKQQTFLALLSLIIAADIRIPGCLMTSYKQHQRTEGAANCPPPLLFLSNL